MTQRPQHGSIEVPEVGSIPALVDVAAGHATAVLLARPMRALADVVGARVGIDIVTSRGLMHVDACLAGVRDGDVLDLEFSGKAQLIQRREYARVDAYLQVTVSPLPGGDQRIPTVIVNISGSGAVVSHLGSCAPGDGVDLWLSLSPADAAIPISGRVVRKCDEHLRAVHFESVGMKDRERIVHFVFERQRMELQRVRRA